MHNRQITVQITELLDSIYAYKENVCWQFMVEADVTVVTSTSRRPSDSGGKVITCGRDACLELLLCQMVKRAFSTTTHSFCRVLQLLSLIHI